MDIIGDAFAQGVVPGIVIAIVYVVEKIISSRKKDPLVDIAKLLNIVTKDIIEKDREKILDEYYQRYKKQTKCAV